MAASVILVQFFYSDGSTLPAKVWVMDGTMPCSEWPDANMVFGLNMVGDAIRDLTDVKLRLRRSTMKFGIFLLLQLPDKHPFLR